MIGCTILKKYQKNEQRQKGSLIIYLKIDYNDDESYAGKFVIDLDEAHGKRLSYEQSAKSNGVCIATVFNTIKLYHNDGLESLITFKRNLNSDNARRKLDGRTEARFIEIACSPAPEGHSRWTLRLLEEQGRIILDTPVGKNAIGRALKKTNFDLTKTPTGAS